MSRFVVEAEQFEYKKEDELGSGSYGSVYKGIFKRSDPPMPVAIKVSKNEVTPDEWLPNLRELSLLAQMKHPGTLHLIGFHIQEGHGPTIITPLFPNGTVDNLLKKEKKGEADARWDATKKSMCVFGVPAGMAYLHSHGVLHRDLKPANVFLDEHFEPVIGDFGLARDYKRGGGDMTMALGTPWFMAPELYMDDYRDKYTGVVDVYAYAVFLYQLLSPSEDMTLDDKKAVRSKEDWMMRVGRRGARPVRPDGISDFYWDLIKRCWSQNPNERPRFIEILDHLQKYREKYAFHGCDIEELKAYEQRVLEGIERVDRTNDDPIEPVTGDCYERLYLKEPEPEPIPEYMTCVVSSTLLP